MTTALHEVCSGFEAFRPPKRMHVSDGAASVYYIRTPGGYVGPWSADETPYLVEPMDMLASRRHEAVVFVGPARTGKTAGLVLGWTAHNVVHDPGDELIVQMTETKAREFSKTDLARMLRHSPGVREMMSSREQDHNTFDVMFRHGMWLRIGWPTVSNLSGSTYRYVALTDYDRMPDTEEGAVFGLALKRTQTFMSRGMTLVESSPGKPITDPNWRPATPHEAPPCDGILGIYNRSDRRRWYWPCPSCGEYFQAKPGLELFHLPSEDVLLEAVRHESLDEMARQYCKPICPACGTAISRARKHDMNRRGRWVPDGQVILADGRLEGDPPQSNIAGYWIGGVAAAYQNWHSVVLRYLQALRDYALTGSELALQTTANTDQGAPYISRLLADGSRSSEGPESRKEAALQRFIVPDEARFLTAAVDVQGGQNARFIVEVHAHGLGLESWIVDRFAITESLREGTDGEPAPLDPASYAEDWDVLTQRVVKATYRLTTEGRELRIRKIAVDSGGEDGVTENAYAWYRKMRREQFHGRIMLVKGASTKTAPLIRESFVGAKKKDDAGDVPLYMLNTNLLKDTVMNNYKRSVPGPGYMHIPGWLPQSWFDELAAEVRLPDGTWSKIKKRNEAIDLGVYNRAALLVLKADRINWEAPPPWAMPLAENSDVITSAERRAMQADAKGQAPVTRRRSASAYLGR